MSVVIYGRETWIFTGKPEEMLRIFKRIVLTKDIYGPVKDNNIFWYTAQVGIFCQQRIHTERRTTKEV